MINLKVELGERSYPVFIGKDILPQLAEMLNLYGYDESVVVVTDTCVQDLYGTQIAEVLAEHVGFMDTISLPAGEKSKTLATVENIITTLLKLKCDRNLTVLAFGGGVVGDIAGFAAAIFKRGVRYIQVPTTLLAMVDSGIGGKTGVNHALGKNQIGAFHQPKMVWSDLALLESLPEREVVCGLGEVIKYGVIKDADFFAFIEKNLDDILALRLAVMPEVVKRCCEIKAEVVAQDEYESGLRMILNFGHTVGHAIEWTLGYGQISHGEAVLLGMLAESKIAVDAGILSEEHFGRIRNIVQKFGLTEKVTKLKASEVQKLMSLDKKAAHGKIRFALPQAIGEVAVFDDISAPQIENGIEFILQSP